MNKVAFVLRLSSSVFFATVRYAYENLTMSRAKIKLFISLDQATVR